VIRLQPEGACPRPLGPPIGVRVVTATLDGAEVTSLHDARVELLDAPVFEGRNGLAFEDTLEPIAPLHVRVRAGGITFQRGYADDDGNWLLAPGALEPPAPALAQRLGVATEPDRVRFRGRRRAAVRAALAAAGDPVAKLALELRLLWLQGPPGRLDTALLGAGMRWQADLAGPQPIAQTGELDLTIDTDGPWPFRLWLGVWDADALCAYASGHLLIPTI
jgi:hypothetical protein